MTPEECRSIARECGLEAEFDLATDEVVVRFWSGSVSDFYKAAYNRAIKDALYVSQSVKCYDAIRSLEMK